MRRPPPRRRRCPSTQRPCVSTTAAWCRWSSRPGGGPRARLHRAPAGGGPRAGGAEGGGGGGRDGGGGARRRVPAGPPRRAGRRELRPALPSPGVAARQRRGARRPGGRARPASRGERPMSAPAAGRRALPHIREFLADSLTPLAVYRRLAEVSAFRFLFESVSGGEQVSRFSFLRAA